tara:strand:+ start:56678 stop:57202 length:525 start_codon:yes stop_codon:yes gene_type:complete
MAVEKERKFLVKDTKFLLTYPHTMKYIYQYYINEDMRIRLTGYLKTEKAYLTIKKGVNKLSRMEWESEMDLEGAEKMINEMKLFNYGVGELGVGKIRHILEYSDDDTWEVDVFMGDNEDLVLAEIELHYGRKEKELKLPSWVGEEVTGVEKYYNANLAKYPYKDWTEEEKNVRR